MVDKVGRGKVKVVAARKGKHHLIDVAEYKAAQVDKQFEASFNTHPEVLERMAQKALDNLRAGRSEDLNPDDL